MTEAGYPVIGPDAIPFRTCALENVRVLMRYGLTFGAMLAVSRCSAEPMPCQREYMQAAGLTQLPPGRAYATHPTPHTRSALLTSSDNCLKPRQDRPVQTAVPVKEAAILKLLESSHAVQAPVEIESKN